MGLSDDFIAQRAQAVSAEAEADARWAAFRETQEPQIQPLINSALDEAVRGLSGARVPTQVLRLTRGEVAEDHRAWRLKVTYFRAWCWITTEGRVHLADSRRVQRQGDDVWIVNTDDLWPEALPASAFVVSKTGELIAHLISGEGQHSWQPFEKWLLEHMTAIAEPTRLVGDRFPGTIPDVGREAAYEWARTGKWKY